jgi:hypothetical protein
MFLASYFALLFVKCEIASYAVRGSNLHEGRIFAVAFFFATFATILKIAI